MQPSSKLVVRNILQQEQPKLVLDAPCGKGWIAAALDEDSVVDGIDLYATPRDGFRTIMKHDLEQGLPTELTDYDCVCCCEGIEHFGNPRRFFQAAHNVLKDDGLLIVTTPNVWNPESRLQFLFKGFLPGFPCLAGRIEPGTHMHITPWSYPQLYLYLKLEGFVDIELHTEELSRARHVWEYPFGVPQKIYSRNRQRKAKSADEREFWKTAGSNASVYGRHLIVTARKPATAQTHRAAA